MAYNLGRTKRSYADLDKGHSFKDRDEKDEAFSTGVSTPGTSVKDKKRRMKATVKRNKARVAKTRARKEMDKARRGPGPGSGAGVRRARAKARAEESVSMRKSYGDWLED